MKKILVIDDEDWLREMVHMALSEKGYEVVEAGNGARGIEVAQKELPDLILCDVNMQKVDGYGTLSSLREQPATASIPFILMTGAADPQGMRHGMELGADDYLPKPFTIDALYGAVEARLKKADTVRQHAERKLADLRDNLTLMLPHELRTPLNGILAYGEILSTDAANLPANEVAEMGQVIHDAGQRLQRLIENFLIYAQLELLGADVQKLQALRQRRTVAPGPVIEKQAREQARIANRTSDLILNLRDIPLPISEDYLVKVVGEVIQNSFKFSNPGTLVKVSLTDGPGYVSLAFIDHGRGISTDQIKRVGAYMQFDRKMQEQQGLGLGLSIARRLTELHGGTLTIQSVRGEATTVTVKLPKA